jgi:hypothetical protein
VISFSIAPRLQLNMDNGDFYDFHDFFNLFLETQVCNLRECLLEWLLRARGAGTGNRVQIPRSPDQVVLFPTDESVSTDALKEITLTECDSAEYDMKTSHTANSDHLVLHTDADSITDLISLIPGEAVISVDKMRWCVHVGRVQDPAPQPYPGCMVTTNYRVVLLSPRRLGLRSTPTSPVRKKGSEEKEGPSGQFEGVQCCDGTTHSRYGTPRYFSMTSVPLSSIFRLYVAQPRNVFCIVVKDFRVIRIVVSSGVSGGLKSAVNMTAVTSSSSSNSSSGPYMNGVADEGAALSETSDGAAGGRVDAGPGVLQIDGGVSSGQKSMDNSTGRRSSSDAAAGSVGNARHSNGAESDHRVGVVTANGSVGIDIRNMMNEKVHRANNDIGNHGDSYSDDTSHGHNKSKASSNGNDNASVSDSHYNMRDAVQSASNGNNSSSSSNNNQNSSHNNNTSNGNDVTHNNSDIRNNNNGSNGTKNIFNQSNYRSTPHSINNGPLSPTRAESLVITLNRLCFQHPSKPVDRPFAFRYAIRLRHDGWSHSDILTEYRRQGLLEGSEWKVQPCCCCSCLER